METVTQALLGAAVGQCFVGKLGRRAVWMGAIGGTIPDLDVIAIAFTGPLAEYQFHRGPTHSFWFGPVVGTVLGYATWRWYRRKREDPSRPPNPSQPDPAADSALRWWILMWVLALFTHPLLDLFTPYGTMFLSPFSKERFAANGVAIIDPLYSLLLFLALLAGFLRRERLRLQVTVAVLAVTTAYLFYGLWLNGRAAERAREDLAAKGIDIGEVTAYPTILQVFLRRVVARRDTDIHVAHFTMWGELPITWESFKSATGPEVDRLLHTEDAQIFLWFADNQTAIHTVRSEDGTTVEIDDLRYGFPITPQYGLWGMRGKFDAEGNLLSEPELFNRPRIKDLGHIFRKVWKATFALEQP